MKRLPRTIAALGYLLGGLLVMSGSLSIANSAVADVDIDNGEPGMLRIESAALPDWTRQMNPGDVVYWPITTMLDFSEPGQLTVRIEHTGTLAEHPDGLVLMLQKCAEPWEGDVPECATGAETVVADPYEAIAPGTVIDIGRILPDSGPYFLATLSLPETMPNELQGTTAALAFGFTALGDDTSVVLPPGLPNTGSDPSRLGGALALGLGIVLAGLVLTRQRAAGHPVSTDAAGEVI